MMGTAEKLVTHFLFSLFTLGLTLLSIPINADQTVQLQSHHSIKQSAKQFLMENIETEKYSKINIKMGKLDSRLQLQQCNTPLVNSLAPGARFSGKTTLHVRCNSSQPWTVYLTAHIKLYTKVLTTNEPLDKGHILKKNDLISTEIEANRLKNGYFTDATSLIGKQLKRRLPQNKLIKPNYVKSPTLVKRGEIVSIVAKNPGYSVKMTGTAMMSGSEGDRIRVKNLSSRRIIEGTVKQAGIVTIN